MSTPNSSGPVIGDLAGVGQIINSEVAKRTYEDALSPTMRQFGGLSEDTMRAFRLFTAPIQLMAAYQDRFSAFCDRVRSKVPEDCQREAPAEIGRPFMEAFGSTSDDSPLMTMFEELMARAIDAREAEKLSPSFPRIIRDLSPWEARLIAALGKGPQTTDDLYAKGESTILQRVGANFDFNDFGGHAHHLTIAQNLETKKIVSIQYNQALEVPKVYPVITVPSAMEVRRTKFELTMFGRWFASACLPKGSAVS